MGSQYVLGSNDYPETITEKLEHWTAILISLLSTDHQDQ